MSLGRLLFCVLFGGLISFPFGAVAQRCVWAEGLPRVTAAPATSRIMATDGAGNSYLTGQFSGRLVLGGDTLTAAPGQVNVLVAKYDSTGQPVWARVLGGAVPGQASALAVNSAGQVFVAGYARAGFTAGLFTTSRAGWWLTKFDAYGSVLWIRVLRAGNGGNFELTAATTDQAGNCLLGGNAAAGDSLGALVMPAATRVFVAKTSSTGTVAALQPLTGSLYSEAALRDLIVDQQGNTFCTGWYTRTISLGSQPGQTLSGDSAATMFVVSLGPSLQPQWARCGYSFQGLGRSDGFALGTDGAGNCYLTGTSQGLLYLSAAVYTYHGGVFLAKYTAQGTPVWVRTQSASTPVPVDAPTALAVDPQGNSYLAGFYQSATISFGNQTLTGGALGQQRPFLVNYSPSGTARWIRTAQLIPAPPQLLDAAPKAVGLDARGRLYMLGQHALRLAPSLPCAITFDGQPVPGPGFYLARFDPSAQVSGLIYLDANGNGRRDGVEGAFPATVIVEETTRQLAFAAGPPVGTYTAFVPMGAYGLLIPEPPRHYTVSAPLGGLHYGQLNATGQVIRDKDFGLAPVANRPDVRVSLTPVSRARAGFITSYHVVVENVGTTPASGTVTLVLDAHAQYIASTPTANVTGSTLAWNYANLGAFGRFEATVQFSLPLNVAIGVQLVSNAAAPSANDVEPADNAATATQTVVGSFDPNAILVNYPELSPNQVAAGQPLDYTVMFQNVGTDTAFAVVVQDQLPIGLLKLPTLQLIAQSHNCTWSLNGQGRLTVRFSNIKLPHKGINALRSQGFVRFRITPQNNLTLGTVIPNSATITFDFNPAIFTNQVTTLVASAPTGLGAAGDLVAGLRLTPNPAATEVRVAAMLPQSGALHLLLTDVLGRVVCSQQVPAAAGLWQHTLNLSGVTPGLYGVRLVLPDGHRLSGKLVVGP